jgi:hypothetical protein
MTLKQDLKALQKEFRDLGKKVDTLTTAVEKAEKTQAQAAKAKTVKKTPVRKKAPVKKKATAAKTRTTRAKRPIAKRRTTRKAK